MDATATRLVLPVLQDQRVPRGQLALVDLRDLKVPPGWERQVHQGYQALTGLTALQVHQAQLDHAVRQAEQDLRDLRDLQVRLARLVAKATEAPEDPAVIEEVRALVARLAPVSTI